MKIQILMKIDNRMLFFVICEELYGSFFLLYYRLRYIKFVFLCQ